MDPKAAQTWSAPSHWMAVTAIDAHTEGEPFRVITGGFPELQGETILAKRRYAKEHFDHLRRALMWEPRGHADMYGCLITPPVSPSADFGILFMHNEGFSTMCGHGIIGITKVALETGMIPIEAPETTVRMDTPAGLVVAHARIDAGRVGEIRFANVPSFVLGLDLQVQVPGVGPVKYDLAFGGAFYAFVDVTQVQLTCTPNDFGELISKGMAIKRAVMETAAIDHPFEADLGFLYGTIFTGPPEGQGDHSRHVCVFADGEVDRCPTGTGVSGRLAILHARGQVEVQESIVIESILGTRFKGRILETTSFGPYDAVIPEVAGTAHITGQQTLLIDPDDPLKDGFILR